MPTVGSYRVTVSDKRGTPIRCWCGGDLDGVREDHAVPGPPLFSECGTHKTVKARLTVLYDNQGQIDRLI